MTMPADNSIRMDILSKPAHLPVVRAALERICEQIGFGEEATGGVVLSVDEALTNVIKHAYDGADDKPIEVELTPVGGPPVDGLQIRIRDYGRVVDPAKIKSRDLADVRPGGLGVHIMQKCMDTVRYQRAAGGGTLLTMVKTRTPQQQDTKA